MNAPFKTAYSRWIEAVRENVRAALLLQGIVVLTVVGYYLWPPSAWLLLQMADWQRTGGVLFAFTASGLAGGVLSEVVKVLAHQRGDWSKDNTEEMFFKFFLTGFGSVALYYFYIYQRCWFGDGLEWQVFVPKLLVDQFLFVPVWSVPYNTLLCAWRNCGYSWAKTRRELKTGYFSKQYLPLLLSCWSFWIPVAACVYCLPYALQMPLSILAGALWALLMVSVTRPRKKILPQALTMPA